MTRTSDAFERFLVTWLDEEAAGRPEYLPEALARIDRARQRPAWASLERWLPMELTMRTAAVPRWGWLLAMLTLLVTVLLLAAAAGDRSPGPARTVANGLIAFDSKGDIVAVNDDNTGRTTLADLSDPALQPAWSPDGRRLAYRVTHGDGASGDLVIAAEDGTVQRTITAVDGHPMPYGGMQVWSSDGRTVAVKAGPVTGDQAVSDAVLSTLLLVDPTTGDGTFVDMGLPIGLPRWSPDDPLVAIDSGDPLRSVYVAAPDGMGLTRISDEGRWAALSDAIVGTFTPDGDWVVAFQQAPDRADHDIVLAAVDGSGTRTIVGGPTDDVYPSVSPDGTMVVFYRTAASPDASGLYVATVDGRDVRPVSTDLGISQTSALWSPDSTKVVTSTPAYAYQLVITVDGSVAPVLIPSPENIGNVSWQAVRR